MLLALTGFLALATGTPGAQTAAAGPATAPSAASSELFGRMVELNAGLDSYTASVKVDVALHSFPFLSPTLEGDLYHKRPDREAIVFRTYPVLASAFKKIYPQFEPASRWNALFYVTQGPDTGTLTQFTLVPRKHGRIDHIDAFVDDQNATVKRMVWHYNDDSGTVSFSSEYTEVDGNYLIKAQTGKVDLDRYKADVDSTFSNFKVNVAISDDVFK